MNKYYVLGVGLLMAVFSLAVILWQVEDKEQRNTYLVMGLYNVACVGITYFMTNRLRASRTKRLEEQERKKEWDALPQQEKNK
mmetsp:Transcript_1508/g.2470  ORF Transcript_1508/g.2470 Transcript_1508/m.2470 type:complete len:83 (-) Transcript_1508:176-424(-)